MDEKEHLLSKSTPEIPNNKSGWRQYWSYDCVPFIPARYTLALVSCLGFINVYALRVNLSVAIVQMANSTATARNSSAEVRAACSIIVTQFLFVVLGIRLVIRTNW